MLTTVVAYAVLNLPSVSFSACFFIQNQFGYEDTKIQIIIGVSLILKLSRDRSRPVPTFAKVSILFIIENPLSFPNFAFLKEFLLSCFNQSITCIKHGL